MQTRWRRRLTGWLEVHRWVDLETSGGDRRLWRGPLDLFDKFALGFIGAVFLVLVIRMPGLDPFISDTWYHLAIAKQIAARGELPSWVDWDYAPVGRPHLYPPLIHVLLAGLSRLTGSLLVAGRLMGVVFLPASLLTCWWAGRWVFGSRAALVAVLALSLDAAHAVVELIYIPSCLVNILAPLLLMTFLTRRTWWSIILLTLMLYAHIAIPYLVVLGLALFAWKYPRYRGEFAKVAGVALLWVSPWIVRTLLHHEWVAAAAAGGLPMGLWKRILSLQMFNLVLVGCGLAGLRNLRGSRAPEAIVRWMLLGMLPLLFSYGGRFTMHSAPWFALSAATVLVRLIPARAGWRHATALTAATLLPSPALLPMTTTHALLVMLAQGRPIMANDRKKSEVYLPDCDQALAWVSARTAPGEVVYVNKEWLGDMVPLLSDRRADFGCWWECSREIGKLQNRYYRDDGRRAVFLCIRPDSDVGSILGPTPGMPRVDVQADIGRLRVGVRHERRFSRNHRLDTFDGGPVTPWESGLREAGASAEVTRESPERRYLSWYLPTSAGGARLSRPVSCRGADGVALNIRASAPLGDVKLGVVEADGSRYEFPLALPCVAKPVSPADIGRAQWLRVRVAFDWMSPAAEKAHPDGKADAESIVRLYLEAPAHPGRPLRLDLDDIDLMDVEVVK